MALGANPGSVTMSGFSAGSYMTNQMHVIYSKTIKGVGMVAGGPYYVGKIYNETRSTDELVENAFYNMDRNMRNG